MNEQTYIAICSLRFWRLFFKNLSHSYFFGQIWSQNFKSFRLTEISYRRTLLYACDDVSVIFSKFLSFIFFGLILSQNLKFSKLTKIWYRNTLLYAYCDFNVYFGKIFVIDIFSANLVSNSTIWYRGTSLYGCCNFNVCFFKGFVIHIILGKFSPKIWCPNSLKSSICVHYSMLIIIESFSFSKFSCWKCFILFSPSWWNYIVSLC